MFSELFRYISGLPLPDLGRDLLDIFITYYIFYRIALVLKGTRAMQIGVGLVGIFVLYVVAEVLRLHTVLTLLGAVLSSAILIAVVVFQNDIRRGLMRVGAGARFGSGTTLEAKVIDAVVEAATVLARHRIGALITFEQEANLDEFVGSHTGTTLDAAVTPELLVSLFIPEGMNKLHDGALVIRELRIAKAGVFFPLPEGRVSDASFGSRHRAAMGITEETDAVVIVVSEERGSISFCFNGNIVPNLDGPRLRAALDAVFAPKSKERRPGLFSRWFGPRPKPSERHSAPPKSTRISIEPALSSLPRRLSEVHPEPAPEPAPRPLRKRPTSQDGEDGPAKRVPSEAEVDHDPEARPTATTGLKAFRPDEAVQPLRKNLEGHAKKPAEAPEAVPSKVEPPRSSDSAEETPETRRAARSDPPGPARPMPRADETPRVAEASLDADRPSSERIS
jgi:diadenylate cyclase